MERRHLIHFNSRSPTMEGDIKRRPVHFINQFILVILYINLKLKRICESFRKVHCKQGWEGFSCRHIHTHACAHTLGLGWVRLVESYKKLLSLTHTRTRTHAVRSIEKHLGEKREAHVEERKHRIISLILFSLSSHLWPAFSRIDPAIFSCILQHDAFYKIFLFFSLCHLTPLFSSDQESSSKLAHVTKCEHSSNTFALFAQSHSA